MHAVGAVEEIEAEAVDVGFTAGAEHVKVIGFKTVKGAVGQIGRKPGGGPDAAG